MSGSEFPSLSEPGWGRNNAPCDATMNKAGWTDLRTSTAELPTSVLASYNSYPDAEEIHVHVDYAEGWPQNVQEYIPHRTLGPKGSLLLAALHDKETDLTQRLDPHKNG